LPAWCDINLDKYMESERSWLASLLVGGKPNRQQTKFWMDRRGPHCYLLILQTYLIFTGIYVGLLLVVFLPRMYEQYNMSLFGLFLTMGAVPIIGITQNRKQLVAMLAQVCYIASFREPQLVCNVLQEAQTIRIIRSFIVVCKLRRATLRPSVDAPKAARVMKHRNSFSQLEMEEVGETFDAIDTDRSGSLSRGELKDLLVRLGVKAWNDDDIARIVALMDTDGDGEIQRDEFLTWYTVQAELDNLTVKEQAEEIFDILSNDDLEEITSYQFQKRVDALQMGLSAAEVGAILRELDRDGDGKVTVQEIVTLLHNYCAQEL
jgi:Ca2+-binding EF-hand superfamily protein